MLIYRTETFKKALKKLRASDQDLMRLEAEIVSNPQAGDVIQGLSGARKIRFAMGGKGKSGGGRAIYIVIVSADTAYLLTAYAKAEKSDLSSADRDALKRLIEAIKLLGE